MVGIIRNDKNIRIAFATVLALAAFTFTITASADGITKRVKFAKGRSSATMSGAVIRGDRDTYILGAKGGQLMSVKITSLEKNAAFEIIAPDGEYLTDIRESEDAFSWSGSLPVDGDYRIVVGGTRGNASYKLTVSIK
jgi:hypothetical protein